MRRLLPDDSPRSIAVACGLGAASSSCSYAAVALPRSLFRKGADFTASIAFMFASTNLVIELGIIMWLLLGWQFVLGEFIGGPVIAFIFADLIVPPYPRHLPPVLRLEDGRVPVRHLLRRDGRRRPLIELPLARPHPRGAQHQGRRSFRHLEVQAFLNIVFLALAAVLVWRRLREERRSPGRLCSSGGLQFAKQ